MSDYTDKVTVLSLLGPFESARDSNGLSKSVAVSLLPLLIAKTSEVSLTIRLTSRKNGDA